MHTYNASSYDGYTDCVRLKLIKNILNTLTLQIFTQMLLISKAKNWVFNTTVATMG